MIKLALADQKPEASPEQQLALAVICKALADLRRGDEFTLAWFKHERSNLQIWCETLGIDATVVREKALAGEVRRVTQRGQVKRTSKAKVEQFALPGL
jgi:hypothetical protein